VTAPHRYAAECLGPGVMQLRDQAVVDVLHCVRETLLSKRLKPAAAVRCQRLLREAERTYLWSVSSSRQDRVVPVAALEESDSGQDAKDWITTHEAAELLGCGVRTVQRLAPALGRLRAGRWELDRRRVLAHQDIEQEREDDRAAAAAA
jgi:excisionase family DNA binding protein